MIVEESAVDEVAVGVVAPISEIRDERARSFVRRRQPDCAFSRGLLFVRS